MGIVLNAKCKTGIAIIGGGLGSITAACALLDRGVNVVMTETYADILTSNKGRRRDCQLY